MEDLDIQNAITTLDTIYFFKCAQRQGHTQASLEDVLIRFFNFTRKKATWVIYNAAPYYHLEKHNEKCENYLIRHVCKILPD